MSYNYAVEHLDHERLHNNTLLEDLEEILDELNGRPYSKDEEKHLNQVLKKKLISHRFYPDIFRIYRYISSYIPVYLFMLSHSCFMIAVTR